MSQQVQYPTRVARGIGNKSNVRADRAAFILPAVLSAVSALFVVAAIGGIR